MRLSSKKKGLKNIHSNFQLVLDQVNKTNVYTQCKDSYMLRRLDLTLNNKDPI